VEFSLHIEPPAAQGGSVLLREGSVSAWWPRGGLDDVGNDEGLSDEG
jgi:hypothetical protein